jgi:hypothetical protein
MYSECAHAVVDSDDAQERGSGVRPRGGSGDVVTDTTDTKTEAFFSSDLEQAELDQILRRIDEGLALRPLFREPPADAAPVAPDLGDLPERLSLLKTVGAPLFTARGWRPKSLAKKLVNLPIRVLGRKQIYFDWQVLAALDEMLSQFQAQRGSLAQLAEAQRELAEAQQQLAATQRELAATQQQQEETQRQLAEEQQGHGRWVTLLQRKHDALALDVRELRDTPVDPESEPPEPRIPDPERYRRLLDSMPDGPRINLGCGEQPWEGWINVDYREMPGVDIVADVRRLPIEPGSADEIASAHLFEHFREHQLRTRIVPYWLSLLRHGGRLRIICPNWEAMLARLNAGTMSLADFKLVTFGAQDYVGDDHFSMFTPGTLSDLLTECGFNRIEVLAYDRMNGLCPEMEVVAHR